MEPKLTTPVVKGLILALVLIVFSLVLQFTGQAMNKGLSSIQYIFIIGGIIWGCINYSNQMNNRVSFGNIFAHGFKMTAVATVLVIIYSVIAFKFLFPEMVDQAPEQATAELEKKNMSDDEIEQGMSITRKFFLPFAIAGILVGFMIIGAISSLIGAAVAKKKPQDPFAQQG